MTKTEAVLLAEFLKQDLMGKSAHRKKSTESKIIDNVIYLHDNEKDENGWKVYVIFSMETGSGEVAQKYELNRFYETYEIF